MPRGVKTVMTTKEKIAAKKDQIAELEQSIVNQKQKLKDGKRELKELEDELQKELLEELKNQIDMAGVSVDEAMEIIKKNISNHA